MERLVSSAATSFSFDRQTMARLRSLGPHDAVVGALRALMAPHVLASEPHAEGARASGKLANMYVSCAEESAVHDAAPGLCHGRRLVVPAERLGDFYDILAADVRNPGKTGLLAAVWVAVLREWEQRPVASWGDLAVDVACTVMGGIGMGLIVWGVTR